MMDPVAFLLAAFVLLIAPGPTNTVLAVAGAGAGAGRSPLRLVAAMLAGYVAAIMLARLVLLPLIEIYPRVDTVARLIIVAYLVFAAFRLWRSPLTIGVEGAPVSFSTVLLTTFLNPKGLIFAVSVFPHGDAQLVTYFALFCVVAGGCGYVWFAFGHLLARLSGTHAAILPRVGAVALLVFAFLVAVSTAR